MLTEATEVFMEDKYVKDAAPHARLIDRFGA